MAATHHTFEKDGIIYDQLTAGDLSIAVARRGAELISLRQGEMGFLYRDGLTDKPAAGWANHATVMGYFLHRLWKEESVYRGQAIRSGNHGFIRHFVFDPPAFDAAAGSLTYEVQPERIPPEAYPLKVRLRLAYRLAGGRLTVEFHFINEEAELDAHVSFGLHPGFAVASVQTARVEFPAGTYLRHLAPGNFLDGQIEPVAHAGGEMPFDKALLPGSFLLELSQVPERTFVLSDPETGRRVTLDFAEVPYLTVWSEGADYICIEPCWGLPDSNPPAPFEQKAGIEKISAGAALIRAFAIAPEQIKG
ncbi:MAG TPA: hypothetical protein VIS74_02770 [Chthoniobacterales bacterium]